jgi:hypothetical protein
MSMMYGKHRVVLSKNPRYNEVKDLMYEGGVSLCGSRSGQGGTYNPLGFWYRKDGLFFADIKPSYFASRCKVSDLVPVGGLRTAKELREFIMAYAHEHNL